MVVNGWYTCPRCHKRLIQIKPESILYGTPVYCRTCKKEWFPAIYRGRELTGEIPDFFKTES